MLKKLFATFVSVAMLFSMSTSAMSVQAEDSDLVTIEGEVNGTVTLYYPETTTGEVLFSRNFSFDPNIQTDDIYFRILEENENVTVSHGYGYGPEDYVVGSISFHVKNPEPAMLQIFVKDEVIKNVKIQFVKGKYIAGFKQHSSNRTISSGETLDLNQFVLSYALPENGDFSDDELTYQIEDDRYGIAQLDGDKLTLTDEGFVSIRAVGKKGESFYITIVALSDEVKFFGFGMQKYTWTYYENTYYFLEFQTDPYFAIMGFDSSKYDISISDPTVAEVIWGRTNNSRIALNIKKPGNFELKVTYNDLSAVTTIYCDLAENIADITADTNSDGDIYVNGSKVFPEWFSSEIKGSNLTLSANPKPGYHFSHWVIDGQDNKTSSDINGTLDITVDADTTIAAVFTPCDDQEIRGAVKSTCTVSGYTGDVYCKRHNVLIKQGETLSMTDHNYVDHICTECLQAEEGYTAFIYQDENGKYHGEVNTIVGFADVKDEYSLTVGSPVTISQKLKYEKEPTGEYMLGPGSDPEIKDKSIAKADFDAEANTVTVTPLKAGTTVMTLDLMGYTKEVKITVHSKQVTFTVEENPQGAVIVNDIEMKDGANLVESNVRTNMYTAPKPGYHFDYWIIDGQKEEGIFGSNGGLRFYPDKDMTIKAVFKECDDAEVRNAVTPTCTKTGYSGDLYCKKNNVLIKKGEVLPMTEHVYEDHVCTVCGAKEEVKEDKPEPPVTGTIKEEVVIDVPATIPEEVADTIKKTIKEVKVENVVDSIPESVKNDLITEMIKDIDTTGKEVQIKVVNTVKVTEVDLKSENKSITYEISPKAVVTVDGVVVNTADLKNDQLTGKKDIEVTLPINGLDLKEIVHKSEGYDPEYIYDFVISKEGTVTFKISHFSSFTLNEEITKPADSSTDTGDKVVVDTGDHTDIMLYGGVGIIAAMCALALILFRRKHA